MAFTKIWLGTTGDASLDTNWEAISVRTAAWSWTASGSGTNEYYLRTAANGNPGFAAAPTTVKIGGTAATSGSIGSLAAGRWGYGDNDSLGYSTLYVRLSDGADPDSKAADHVTFHQVPKASEPVYIAAGSGDMTSNLDLSGTAIGAFERDEGHEGIIGSSTNYLRLNCTGFTHGGSGQAFIDLVGSSISPRIVSTGGAQNGNRGLHLRGTALSVVDVQSGSVGIAALAGEVSTATTVRVMSTTASVELGSGVTLTNLHQYGGEVELKCAATTIIKYGGTLATLGSGTITTVDNYAGDMVANSTGTVTTINLRGGFLDEMQSGAARTFSTVNVYGGRIARNKEAVTHTTFAIQTSLRMSFGEI
jgi:hypothetical protein